MGYPVLSAIFGSEAIFIASLIGIPVIIAGIPVASNAAMMLRQYGGDFEFASELILVFTLFSGITIPILAQML